MNIKNYSNKEKRFPLVKVIRELGKEPFIVFAKDLNHKEMLLAQIQAEAILLNKTPSARDINKASKEKRTASVNYLKKIFGSFNNALQAAGLRLNYRRGFTRKELATQLRVEAKLLNRTPTTKDIDKAAKKKRTASSVTFMRVFSSFSLALQLAGLRPNKNIYYPAGVLINQLQNEAKLLGKTPTRRDINKAAKERRTAGVKIFVKRLGGFNSALQTAGLNPRFKSYSKEELVAQLKVESGLLGKTPSITDINKASKSGRVACAEVFKIKFGTYNNAIRAAGLKPNYRGYFKYYPMRILINQLQNEAELLGKTPSIKNIDKAGKEGRTASWNTFRIRFGTYNNAIRAAGLKPNYSHYHCYDSMGELVKQIRFLTEKLGRIPTMKDVNESSKSKETACANTFVKWFGTYTNALQAAGLKLKL